MSPSIITAGACNANNRKFWVEHVVAVQATKQIRFRHVSDCLQRQATKDLIETPVPLTCMAYSSTALMNKIELCTTRLTPTSRL